MMKLSDATKRAIRIFTRYSHTVYYTPKMRQYEMDAIRAIPEDEMEHYLTVTRKLQQDNQ